MHRQIDGVAMGNHLDPALANIFVSYYKSKLFNKISKPIVYCRYVDGTFFLFYKQIDFQKILTCFNSLHPFLKTINEIKLMILCFFWMYLPNQIIDSLL